MLLPVALHKSTDLPAHFGLRRPVWVPTGMLPSKRKISRPAGQELAQQEHLAGVDRDTLEQAARAGLRNGAFEDSEEEIPEVVEEFYTSSRAAKARQGEVEASGDVPVTAGIPED